MTPQKSPARRLLASAVAVVTASLVGCATPPPETAYLPTVTNVAQRVQALPPLDALLLGEQHDTPDHQRIHRDVIDALATRGALGAVVLEMAVQGHSTHNLNASASEDSVRAALQWDDKAWPWSRYSPAVMAAVRAGVPVLGANLPRTQLRAAMAQTEFDGRLTGPALKAQQQLIRAGHCDLLPQNQITPMTRMQIARDVAMATGVVNAAKSAPYKTVVLLAGSGHVNTALGVPQHLPPGFKTTSILLREQPVAPVQIGPAALSAVAEFDQVWPTAAAPATDYCADLQAQMGAKK